MNVDGVSKIIANDIKIDVPNDREQIRRYLGRIHHGGSKLDQKYIIKGLPPLRK